MNYDVHGMLNVYFAVAKDNCILYFIWVIFWVVVESLKFFLSPMLVDKTCRGYNKEFDELKVSPVKR